MRINQSNLPTIKEIARALTSFDRTLRRIRRIQWKRELLKTRRDRRLCTGITPGFHALS
jgi:hypothetical protein